jgi:hypothetical protein
MDEETIGVNAGKVWKVLESQGRVTRYQLMNVTGLEPSSVDAAIGWLAKENKVHRDGEFFSLGPTNMNKTIGWNAEILFKVLKNVPYDVTKLHELTDLTPIEIHQAIGWLSREGNINLGFEPLLDEIMDENEKTLAFLRDEVEILNADIRNRDEIICQLSRQLTDRQIQFIEQTHVIDGIHNELEKKTAMVSVRDLDLKEKNAQIMVLQDEINSLHEDLISRNQIITDLSKQLTDTQMQSIIQTDAFEKLRNSIVKGNTNIKPTMQTGIQERLNHVGIVQQTLESEPEMKDMDMESRLYHSKLPVLDIQENQQIDHTVVYPKSIDEIHHTVDQVITEKMQKLKNH